MKALWYLINLGTQKLVQAYEGTEDIPKPVQDEAQEAANATGDAHVLARGKLFFQKDNA